MNEAEVKVVLVLIGIATVTMEGGWGGNEASLMVKKVKIYFSFSTIVHLYSYICR